MFRKPIFKRLYKSGRGNYHRYLVGAAKHMVRDVDSKYVMIKIESPSGRFVFTSLTPADATELGYALLAKANGGCQPED